MTDPGGSGHRKRIVVCFDGTANQIGAGNLTNVAKLFEMLNKADPNSQLAYCDPGVGTLAPASATRPSGPPPRYCSCARSVGE